jgi:iron complex transport system ATP-binding protein
MSRSLTSTRSTPHLLRLDAVHYGVDKREILHGISLAVTSGELIAIIGPNGAGKSTLLHVMAGVLAATHGRVSLDGQPLAQLPRRAVARHIALLPQQTRIDFGFAVREVVQMGRYPHRGRLKLPSPDDTLAVQQAMAITETLPLAERLITEVSGGERQLVLFAQALAQEPRFLLLDEPTANLDVAHQCQVMALLQRLSDEGIGVVAVIHDLSMALRCFRRLILLHQGRLVGDGPPAAVLNRETISRVFRVQARFYQDQLSGTPLLWFPLPEKVLAPDGGMG